MFKTDSVQTKKANIMNEKDQATPERILAAAVTLLKIAPSPERVTVRDIAQQAGVAIGAINYHFQTKENLFNQAVASIMDESAAGWQQEIQHPHVDAVTRLRRLLKERARAAYRYRKLAAIATEFELLNGSMDDQHLVLPLLRRIFGSRKTELELRLVAFQLMVTFQVAFLRTEGFKRYAGVDLAAESQREVMIDMLIDQIVGASRT